MAESPRRLDPSPDMTIERMRVGGRYWRENGFSHVQRYDFARDRVSGRVLDVACGVGFGSYLLAARAEQVVGVDLSAEAIAEAREQHARPNIVYHEGTLASLPGGPPFDAAVCIETIEHLAEPVPFLGELRARLKPGGRLIISAPNTLQHQRGTPPQANAYHLSEPTHADLSSWLENDFVIEEEWEQARVLPPDYDATQQIARRGAALAQLGIVRALASLELTLRRWSGKKLPVQFPPTPERGALIADTTMLPLLPARRSLAHTFVFLCRRR